MKSTLLVLTSLLILSGCNYDIKKGEQDSFVDRSQEAEGIDYGFDHVFEHSIRQSCLPCHADPNNRGGYNLESYEEVYRHRREIYKAVASFKMPDSVGRSMDLDKRQLLLEWIEAGAPRD